MSELIEGLPEVVALRCLALVPFNLYPKLEAVSRSWKSAIRSPDLFRIRKELGVQEDLLFVCAYEPENLWQCYDPVVDSWTTLPLLPSKIEKLSNFRTVSTAQKLFVLGGRSGADKLNGAIARSEVWKYDPVARQWALCAPMLFPRYMFACFVMEGKIIVAGGFTGIFSSISQVEIYDPDTDIWTSIPDLNHKHNSPCYGVSYKGKMHVLHKGLSTMQVLVRDNSDFKWVVEKDCWLQGPTAMLNDEVYMMCHEHIFKLVTGKWKQFASVAEFSRRLGFSIVGLKGEIYILGGSVSWWQESGPILSFEPLSDVNVLNIGNDNPTWRTVSPMTKCQGRILGSTVLHL